MNRAQYAWVKSVRVFHEREQGEKESVPSLGVLRLERYFYSEGSREQQLSIPSRISQQDIKNANPKFKKQKKTKIKERERESLQSVYFARL